MNPFAAARTVTGRQSASPLEQFVSRLQAVGATDDEVADVRATWDDFDEDWTPAARKALLAKSDSDLRAAILSGRAEYEYGTTTEEEAAAKTQRALKDRVLGEAREVVQRPVREVLDWVGDDPLRAAAVLDAEQAGADRTTLVTPLRDMLADR